MRSRVRVRATESTALGEAVALAETLVDLVVANQNDVAVTQPALCALANLSTNRGTRYRARVYVRTRVRQHVVRARARG